MLQIVLSGSDQFDLALQLSELLIVAGRGRHLLVQGSDPLVKAGDLLFETRSGASEDVRAGRLAGPATVAFLDPAKDNG